MSLASAFKDVAEREARAHMVVPSLMAHTIYKRLTFQTLIHLGCGRILEPELKLMTRACPELRRLYLLDPVAEYCSRGTPHDLKFHGHVHINEAPPRGTPAISMHPGFTLTGDEMYGLIGKPSEPWHETLNRLEPRWFCFSSYCEDEMQHDIEYLESNTALEFVCRCDNPITKEYQWNAKTGPGFAMALMEHPQDGY